MSFATPAMEMDKNDLQRPFATSGPALDYASGLHMKTTFDKMVPELKTSFPMSTKDTLEMHIHPDTHANTYRQEEMPERSFDTKAMALNIARRYAANTRALDSEGLHTAAQHSMHQAMTTGQHSESHFAPAMHTDHHSEGLLDNKMHLGQHREGLLDHKMHLGQHREGLLDHKMHLGQHREGLLDHKMHIANQHTGLMSHKEALLNLQTGMSAHAKALSQHDEMITQMQAGANPEDVDSLRNELSRIATAVQAQQHQLTQINTTAKADRLHIQSCMRSLAENTDNQMKRLSLNI